jgi:hypothetical protein
MAAWPAAAARKRQNLNGYLSSLSASAAISVPRILALNLGKGRIPPGRGIVLERGETATVGRPESLKRNILGSLQRAIAGYFWRFDCWQEDVDHADKHALTGAQGLLDCAQRTLRFFSLVS